MLKQGITDNKKGLEQITKQFNSISSGNGKKRHEINALRKERTLYDHIFKTLEYQILGQEKKLYELIEQTQKQEVVIKESEENFESIKELVSKNKYEDFYKIIEDEKKKYMEELEYLKTEAKEGRNIYKAQETPTTLVQSKHFNPNSETNKERLNTRTNDENEIFDMDNKIRFYEELFAEFKSYTADEDINLIETYMTKADELNEQLYQDFVDMENEYEDTKRQSESLIKAELKTEERTVSTAITKLPIDEDIEYDVTSMSQAVNKLIVT